MPGGEASSATQVLWGTNINTTEVSLKIKNFINSFSIIDENSENYTEAPFYI